MWIFLYVLNYIHQASIPYQSLILMFSVCSITNTVNVQKLTINLQLLGT